MSITQEEIIKRHFTEKKEVKESKSLDFISDLEAEIVKVAKEASGTYVQFLIERKIREVEKYKELTEEFGKMDQILSVLQDIQSRLAKTSVNASLEREVLEKLKTKLGR